MTANRYASKAILLMAFVAATISLHIYSNHEDVLGVNPTLEDIFSMMNQPGQPLSNPKIPTSQPNSRRIDPSSNSGASSFSSSQQTRMSGNKEQKDSSNLITNKGPDFISSMIGNNDQNQVSFSPALQTGPSSKLDVKPKTSSSTPMKSQNKPHSLSSGVTKGVDKKSEKVHSKIVGKKSNNDSSLNKNFVTPNPAGWNDEKYGNMTNLKKEGDFFIGTRNKTGQTFKIRVEGGDDTTFFPQPADHYEKDSDEYDVIVVGGGLSGTVASLYLTDNNKKILILEKQGHMGGLAAFKKDAKGFTYDRGAAYWTKAYNEQFQIMNHMGISKYFTEYIIPEPIDTYMWNGTLYGGFPHDGIWDQRTLGIEVPATYKNGSRLPVLPSSFGIFKLENLNDDKLQRIPDQPFQQWKNLELDTITAREWVRRMPERFHKRISGPGLYAKERRLWARFQEDIEKGVLKKEDPMSDVIQFLDLYSRSALGTTTDQVSAMGYSNFYVSELEPRFTTPYGTGVVINSMLDRLKAAPNTHMKINSSVVKIKNVKDGAEVYYVQEGKGRMAKAKIVVYACQLTFAPNIIEGLDVEAPKQAQTMRTLPMAHYSVHNVDVTNHPYRECYDTWVRYSDYKPIDFTDMILGRWTELKGYGKGPHDEKRQMLNDYSKNPDNKGTNFAIYHALIELKSTPRDKNNQTYGDYYSAHMAEIAWNRMDQIFGDSGYWKQDFKINNVVTSRWPYSIHITRPGHFSIRSEIMGKSFKNVVFGTNNMGTPSFQESLYRAHCAANKALYKLDPKKFVQQSWSKCNYKQ